MVLFRFVLEIRSTSCRTCCTPDTDTIFYINFTSIERKRTFAGAMQKIILFLCNRSPFFSIWLPRVLLSNHLSASLCPSSFPWCL